MNVAEHGDLTVPPLDMPAPPSSWLLLALATACFAATGCDTASLAVHPAPSMAPEVSAWSTCRPQTVVRVYFGSQMPEGEVDDTAWQGFVTDVVAPRLRDGFTVIDARGQWRTAEGRVIAERSRVLEVVAADDRAQREALIEVVARYKVAFRQQAVLVTRAELQACL